VVTVSCNLAVTLKVVFDVIRLIIDVSRKDAILVMVTVGRWELDVLQAQVQSYLFGQCVGPVRATPTDNNQSLFAYFFDVSLNGFEDVIFVGKRPATNDCKFQFVHPPMIPKSVT